MWKPAGRGASATQGAEPFRDIGGVVSRIANSAQKGQVFGMPNHEWKSIQLGYSAWLGLLAVAPVANLALLWFVAFSKWPVVGDSPPDKSLA